MDEYFSADRYSELDVQPDNFFFSSCIKMLTDVQPEIK